MTDQAWALFDADDVLRAQVLTSGPEVTPAADGSNPEGWREVMIERTADPSAETIDAASGAIGRDLEHCRAERKAAVEARMGQAFLAGFSPSSGPLAGHVLQVRDLEDRTNWLTSQASYRAAVDAGAGDVDGAVFRTAANDTVTVTFAEGHDALMEMAEWGRAIFAASWALKDAIGAAGSVEALDDIDIEAAAWPAPPSNGENGE